jgi:hypothetical protein
MRVFRELSIEGKPEALQQILDKIRGSLTDGWTRVTLDEKQRKFLGPDLYGFHCARKEDRPEASLWICQSGPERLHVSNIVPAHQAKLDYDEYNAILQEFYQRFVKPAVAHTGAKATLTEDEVSIEKWLTGESARRLHQFSKAANKGALHPLDEERWLRFLVAAHKERSTLDPRTLQRWLEEEEGWPEMHAQILAAEYEQARSLLNVYDES